MRVLIFSIALLLATFNLKAQSYQTPSPGKSIVYFARVSNLSLPTRFKYFDGKKLLGKFAGKNYMIYECDPGDHVFWVEAENKKSLKLNLQPDQVYIVEAIPKKGLITARVNIRLIGDKGYEKSMKKISKLLNKKEPKLVVNSNPEN